MCPLVQHQTALADNSYGMLAFTAFEEEMLTIPPVEAAPPFHAFPTSSDFESLQGATTSDAWNSQPAGSVIILHTTPAGHYHFGNAENYPNPPTMNHDHVCNYVYVYEPWELEEHASAAATSATSEAEPSATSATSVFSIFKQMWSIFKQIIVRDAETRLLCWDWQLLQIIMRVGLIVIILLYPIPHWVGDPDSPALGWVEIAVGHKLQPRTHLLVAGGLTFLFVAGIRFL